MITIKTLVSVISLAIGVMTASASYADPPNGDYEVNAGGFIGMIHFNPIGADGSVTGTWVEGSRNDDIVGWWDESSQTIFFVRYLGGNGRSFRWSGRTTSILAVPGTFAPRCSAICWPVRSRYHFKRRRSEILWGGLRGSALFLRAIYLYGSGRCVSDIDFRFWSAYTPDLAGSRARARALRTKKRRREMGDREV